MDVQAGLHLYWQQRLKSLLVPAGYKNLEHKTYPKKQINYFIVFNTRVLK
jgi:hypothetical protein